MMACLRQLFGIKRPFDYSFKVQGYNGQDWNLEDPYTNWVEGVTKFDRYLFNRSQHYKIYEKLGAHTMTIDGRKEFTFQYGRLMHNE